MSSKLTASETTGVLSGTTVVRALPKINRCTRPCSLLNATKDLK